MSTAFEIPEWLLHAPLPPTPVDDHRVEALVNHFIAGKQEALFTALEIEPNKPLGAQRIIPEVYVSGGDSARIERQMRNQGLEVRPAGARGRLRIGGPPL